MARGPGSGPQGSPVGGTRGRPSRSGPGLQSQVGGGSDGWGGVDRNIERERERESCIILEYIALSGILPSRRWPKAPVARLRDTKIYISHDFMDRNIYAGTCPCTHLHIYIHLPPCLHLHIYLSTTHRWTTPRRALASWRRRGRGRVRGSSSGCPHYPVLAYSNQMDQMVGRVRENGQVPFLPG